MWRVKLLGTLNDMKCRSGRQSGVRQKVRVLHEPSHKVDLCVAGIARSQLLLETSQRNFEVMQSIMKFSWCIYSGITPVETCFQLLLHSMKLFNWIKEFKSSPFTAWGNNLHRDKLQREIYQQVLLAIKKRNISYRYSL